MQIRSQRTPCPKTFDVFIMISVNAYLSGKSQPTAKTTSFWIWRHRWSPYPPAQPWSLCSWQSILALGVKFDYLIAHEQPSRIGSSATAGSSVAEAWRTIDGLFVSILVLLLSCFIRAVCNVWQMQVGTFHSPAKAFSYRYEYFAVLYCAQSCDCNMILFVLVELICIPVFIWVKKIKCEWLRLFFCIYAQQFNLHVQNLSTRLKVLFVIGEGVVDTQEFLKVDQLVTVLTSRQRINSWAFST